MIILSDCLTEKVDEGCLKVANSLTDKVKEKCPETIVVSYNRKTRRSDVHLKLNKLFLNRELFSLIKKNKGTVLYIPFASNTIASVFRTWVLSCMTKHNLKVVFVLRFHMSAFAKILLRMSKAEIIALSAESYEFYKKEIGKKAVRLRVGINASQFVPVDTLTKSNLRKKYGVTPEKKVLLHVGHLKNSRNIDKLLNVSEDYHVYLVVSSVTQSEQDLELRIKLEGRANTTIIDFYLEHVEEIYQMADVYLFPVKENENCIDVPLSVLEAAACNIPVVTTDYGELKEFKNESGFYFIDSFETEVLNQAIDRMTACKECNNRQAILKYDWDIAVEELMQRVDEE